MNLIHHYLCSTSEKVTDGLFVQIEPIGSIRGAGAIIQYKEAGIAKSDSYILFRDRDFDKAIPPDVELEEDKQRKYCYYSYRNTIENYLFDISVFFSLFETKKFVWKIRCHVRR